MIFSASRTQTWLSCNRKAGFQYIAGYADEGTDATDFGTTVHAILESYKRDGIPVDLMTPEGALAAEALPYVEHFRSEREGGTARFEGEFTLQGRHKWRGLIDISSPGEVVDYKTTSNFKWAKSAEDLMVDPQAILYAWKEFQTWQGPTVKLMWLYLNKHTQKVRPVTVTMTREHVARAFEALERIADEFQAADDAAPLDPALRHRYVLDVLQPNYDHCGAYGGCPHVSRCPKAPFFSQDRGKKPMNLLERLQEMDRQVSTGMNPLAPAAAAPTRPQEAPPLLGVPPVVTAPTAGAPVAYVAPTVAAFDPGAVPATDAPPATVAPNQVNPPKRGPGRPPGAKNKAKGQETAPPATVQTAVVPGAHGSPAPEPPRDTVPMLPVAAPGPVATPAQPTQAELVNHLAANAAAISPAGHRIDVLYVGCAPQEPVVDFDAIVAKAKIAIGPAYYQGYGYKANGMLLQMVEAVVQHDRPHTLAVRYPNTPEATLCLSMLRGVSLSIIEAIR